MRRNAMPFDATVRTTHRPLAHVHHAIRGGRSQRVFLPRRSTLVLDDAEGATIAVERGCLWVTLENDLRDVVLARGMRFQVDRSGRTIVAAEEDTQLRVVRAATPVERTAAWLRRAFLKADQHWSRRLRARAAPYY